MDVTQEIRVKAYTYGGSGSTKPDRVASSRSFDYATGNTIQKAEVQPCRIVPYTHSYTGSVGLFGSENFFMKFVLNIQEITKKPYMEYGWEAPEIIEGESEADWDPQSVVTVYEIEYEPFEEAAIIPYYLPELSDMYISVQLVNNKTGNIYVDDYVDMRLYTADREEHPYDLMYVRQQDLFYLGIHARNTKRLPYDVSIVLGEQLISYDAIEDKRYIMRSIAAGV